MSADLDGSSQYYTLPTLSTYLPNIGSRLYFAGYINTDSNTQGTVFQFTGTAGNLMRLYLSGGNINWDVRKAGIPPNTAIISAAVSTATWTLVQGYSDAVGGTFHMGLRVGTGSWNTSPGTSGTPGYPTVTTATFGRRPGASPDYYDGRAAHWWIADFQMSTSGVREQMSDAFTKGYIPRCRKWWDYLYNIFSSNLPNGIYYPFYTASHILDEFQAGSLAATGTPTTSTSNPDVVLE